MERTEGTGARRDLTPKIVFGLSLLAALTALAMLLTNLAHGQPSDVPDLTPRFSFPFIGIAFSLVGLMIQRDQPGHAIAWLFSVVGLALTLGTLGSEYGVHQYLAAGSRRDGDLGLWAGDVVPFVMIPAIPVLLMTFPDGRPLGRGCRPLLWIAVAGIPTFMLQDAFASRYVPGEIKHSILGSIAVSDAYGAVATIGAAVSLLTGLGSIVVRTWKADSERRHQVIWLACAGFVVVVDLVISSTVLQGQTGTVVTVAATALFIGGFMAIPVSVAVAILKFRLYDIDVVVSRTLVYGALAAFITLVYVAIVVGVGAVVGAGDKPNLVLSIIATAIVAVAFQPVREMLQRFANRLVYGKRATPYEVLAEFSGRVAETYSADDVLPRMARVLAEGTGAEAASVWLRAGDQLRSAATHPEGSDGFAPQPVTGQLLPDLPGANNAVPVRHQGELLGALAVRKRPGESLTPIEQKLLDDLAHQAGLVLKNVGLSADLAARLVDLRESRKRLVAAQDQERRRLERNLHDGAQQHLVALKVKLGLVEILAAKDPDKARATLQELKGDADEALETLRDLARGIYPPLLADKGLQAALDSQARKATVPVTVLAEGVGRYPQEVEAAVYFCVLEALQNVQKYAAASRATVRLRAAGDLLHWEVEDDGAGFDIDAVPRGSGLTNVSDRLDSLGGSVAIVSRPRHGTTVSGTLPVPGG